MGAVKEQQSLRNGASSDEPPLDIPVDTTTPSTIMAGIQSLDEAVAAMNKLAEDNTNVAAESSKDTTSKDSGAVVPPPLITLPVAKASKVIESPKKTTTPTNDVKANSDPSIPAVGAQTPPQTTADTVVKATVVPPPKSTTPAPRVLKDTIDTTASPVSSSKQNQSSTIPPASKAKTDAKIPVADSSDTKPKDSSSTPVPPVSKQSVAATKTPVADTNAKDKIPAVSKQTPAVVASSKPKESSSSTVVPPASKKINAESAVDAKAKNPSVSKTTPEVVASSKPKETTSSTVVPPVSKKSSAEPVSDAKTKVPAVSKKTPEVVASSKPQESSSSTVVPPVTKKSSSDPSTKTGDEKKSSVVSAAKKTNFESKTIQTASSSNKSPVVSPDSEQTNKEKTAAADKKPVEASKKVPVSKKPAFVDTKPVVVDKKTVDESKKVPVSRKPADVDTKHVVADKKPTKDASVPKQPVVASTNKPADSVSPVSKQKPVTEVKNAKDKSLPKMPSTGVPMNKATPSKKAMKETTIASSKDAEKSELDPSFAFFADERVVVNGKNKLNDMAVDVAAAAIMNQSDATSAGLMFDDDTEKLLERAMNQLESTQKEMSDVKEMIQSPNNTTASSSSKPRAMKPPLPKEAPPKELVKDSSIADGGPQTKNTVSASSKANMDTPKGSVTAETNTTVLSQKSSLLSGLNNESPSSMVVSSNVDPDSKWFSAETKDGVEPRTLQGVALATAFLSTFVVGSAPIVTAAAVPAAAYLAVCRGTTGNLARELGNITMNCVEPLVTTNATSEVVTSAAKLVKQGISEISSIKPPEAVKNYLKKPFAKKRTAKKKVTRKSPRKDTKVEKTLSGRGDEAKLKDEELAKEELAQEIVAQIKKDNATKARLTATSSDDNAKDNLDRNTMKNGKTTRRSSSSKSSVSREDSDTMLEDVRAAVITKVGKIDEPQPFTFLDPEARAEVNARALLAKRLELQRLEANRTKN